VTLLNDSHSEQWLILSIFFVLFAISGLLNRPRARRLESYQLFFIGLFTVIANVAILAVLNKAGMSDQNIFSALLLKNLSIESSFIILGYCLISRGVGQFFRQLFAPRNRYPSQF